MLLCEDPAVPTVLTAASSQCACADQHAQARTWEGTSMHLTLHTRGRPAFTSLPCRSAEAQLYPIKAVAFASRRGKAPLAAGSGCTDASQIESAGICMLFASRFPPRTSEAVLRMLHDQLTPLSIIQKPATWTSGTRTTRCMETPIEG